MTTLLIPGTQATCLEDQNGVIVYNAVRVQVGLHKNDLGGRPMAGVGSTAQHGAR